jgi:maltose alpha-D-glucosyltransferase/alpha-amylase
MRALTLKVFADLQGNMKNLEPDVSEQARIILDTKQDILRRFRKITNRKMPAMKIRIHGDYHLGQVLYTGNDVVIIDFEGEPARPLGERRLKRSVLRDVAGMIRSFHYAAHGVIILHHGTTASNIEDLRQWADLWYYCVAGVFLNSYLAAVGDADFIPKDKNDFDMLLGIFLLEKAIYEIGYEVNNRPDWLLIPIRGTQQILKWKL